MAIHPYFRPRSWERDGVLYRRMGVRVFRRYVAGGAFWQRVGLWPRKPTWRRGNVSNYVRLSTYAEAAHTASFLFMLGISVLSARKGDWSAAGLVLAVNVTINAIPVMVARYNRIRILNKGDRGN